MTTRARTGIDADPAATNLGDERSSRPCYPAFLTMEAGDGTGSRSRSFTTEPQRSQSQPTNRALARRVRARMRLCRVYVVRNVRNPMGRTIRTKGDRARVFDATPELPVNCGQIRNEATATVARPNGQSPARSQPPELDNPYRILRLNVITF
jgi:hypothetical protein